MTTTDPDTLSAQAKGRVCVRCGEEPRVIWAGGVTGERLHKFRCGCGVGKTVLRKRTPYVKERMARMVEQSLERRPEAMPLSVAEIKDYISPNATAEEAYIFLRFCQAQGLNPFVQEVYLVKYDTKAPAAFVVGLNAYLKRAAADADYRGYEAGVIVVSNQDEVIERAGEFLHPGDKLLGAWSVTEMENRAKPLKVTVNFSEYNTGRSIWKQKPATMIVKIAIVQGLRRAVPAVEKMHQSTHGIEVSIDEMPAPEIKAAAPDEAAPDEAAPEPAPAPAEPAQAKTEVLKGYQDGRETGDPANIANWLKTCPKHAGHEWYKSNYGWQHKYGSVWCKRKKIITEAVVHRVKKLAESAGITEAGVNEWYKALFDGRTRSALTDEELLEALDAFGEHVTAVLEGDHPGEGEESPEPEQTDLPAEIEEIASE